MHALLPQIDSDSRVLELGCGGGRIARLVAPSVAELLCSDISDLMVAEARSALRGHENVSFVVANAIGLPGLADESFDAVYAHDVLVNLDPNEILAALDSGRRVLKGGGSLVASFFTIDRPEWAQRQLGRARKAAQQGRFTTSLPRPYTAGQVDAWFEVAGLSIVDRGYPADEAEQGQPHYIVSARRGKGDSAKPNPAA
jgi:ubiquinone/menaquinone biosynthesis C-methylase UbiE